MGFGMEVWSGQPAQTGNKNERVFLFIGVYLSIYSSAVECDIFGVRQAGLRHAETADHLGFSHTPMPLRCTDK